MPQSDRVIDLAQNGQGSTVSRVNVPGIGKIELKLGPEHMDAYSADPSGFTKQVMDRKFGEFRQVAAVLGQGMTPLQRASLSEYVRLNTQKGGIPYAQGSAPVMRSSAPQTSMDGVPYQGTPNMTRTQQAAYMTMPMPVVGDLTGLAADVQMYANDPDSRSLLNYFMTGLGVLGLGASVPPVSATRAITQPPDFPVSPDIRVPAPEPIARTSRRAGTTGRYYGAPRGVDNPSKLGAMRNRLQGSLQRGMLGRNWYDNSYEAADFLTGGRPNYRRLYTGANAVTSAGAQVAGNQGFGIKGYNQAIAGQDIDTGRFPSQARRFMNDAVSGNPAQLGHKTGPFYEAQNVGDPNVVVGRPTNDVWMARAFDYRTPDGEIWSEGLGPAQHRFMDEEMAELVKWANKNKVGGFDDWTPERAQAAIWVDTKARTEGKTIEQAAFDFASELDRFKANINVESEPARGLRHLEGTQTNRRMAEALQDYQRQVTTNERGQDLVSLHAGALTTETAPGYGYYKNNSAPADVLGVLAGTSTGSNLMDPASRDIVEGIAATHGLLRGQESVGYNLLQKPNDVLDRSAASFLLGGAPSQDAMLRFGGALDKEFGGAIIPTNTAQGVNALVVDDLSAWASSKGIDPGNQNAVAKAWQKALGGIAKNTLGVKPVWGTNSGNLVGSFDGFKPSEYMSTIDRLSPGLSGRLDTAARSLAGPLDDIDAALIKEFPDAGQRSEILMTTRRALSEGGFDRVRELVRQGILPAVALGLGVRLLGPSQQSQQPADQVGAI